VSGHGGKREGAGRKKKPDKKTTYCQRLRPLLKEFLKKEKCQAEILDNLLSDHYGVKREKEK